MRSVPSSIVYPIAIAAIAYLLWSSNQNSDQKKDDEPVCPGPNCPQPVDPVKPEPKKPSPKKPWGSEDRLQFEVLNKDKDKDALIKIDIPKSVGEVFDKVNGFLDGLNGKLWWGAFSSGCIVGSVGLLLLRFVTQKGGE